ncbi:MAG: type II secretion system GspH family protein [Fibrobacterota bacterium]|nr:type II secretion system GspH family protein [Fibrobacterota bacterium]
MTLLEILVAMVISVIVSTIAFHFYKNFMGHLERQKQVTSLQEGIRNAVDCINRYLVAGGVSGDSLFFDPHRKLTAALWVNGGHRVFDVSADSQSISVYGNFTGSAASLASPVLNKNIRMVKTDKAGIFTAGGYAYIYAGSAQEVTRIVSIRDSLLTMENDFFAPYPKGTLIFPLERVRIYRDAAQALQVSRERADGTPVFVRGFVPSNHPGDSLEFKVKAVDRLAGQIAYSLTFAAKTRRSNITLARRSDQTVYVRGF